jgi:hypothetical protein
MTEDRATCPHPKKERRDLDYMVLCGDCGQVLSPIIPLDARFFAMSPLR